MLDYCRSYRDIHADNALKDLESCVIEFRDYLSLQVECADVSYGRIDLIFDAGVQLIVILIYNLALRVA